MLPEKLFKILSFKILWEKMYRYTMEHQSATENDKILSFMTRRMEFK